MRASLLLVMVVGCIGTVDSPDLVEAPPNAEPNAEPNAGCPLGCHGFTTTTMAVVPNGMAAGAAASGYPSLRTPRAAPLRSAFRSEERRVGKECA